MLFTHEHKWQSHTNRTIKKLFPVHSAPLVVVSLFFPVHFVYCESVACFCSCDFFSFRFSLFLSLFLSVFFLMLLFSFIQWARWRQSPAWIQWMFWSEIDFIYFFCATGRQLAISSFSHSLSPSSIPIFSVKSAHARSQMPPFNKYRVGHSLLHCELFTIYVLI